MGLDSVELVLETEKQFDIEIPDRVAEKLFTVGALHGFVVTELQRRSREHDADVVFEKLRKIICKQLAISPDRITVNARFKQDLGID